MFASSDLARASSTVSLAISVVVVSVVGCATSVGFATSCEVGVAVEGVTVVSSTLGSAVLTGCVTSSALICGP